jgi:hypothetical protein
LLHRLHQDIKITPAGLPHQRIRSPKINPRKFVRKT